MTKEIQLTQGEVALVDDEDFEWLNEWNWNVSKSGKSVYAVRRHGIKEGGDGELITMHRVIMGDIAIGLDVDHIDGNGLNNQRSTNLRVCTRGENVRNRRKPITNNEKYKGIKTIHNKKRVMYRAIIGHSGTTEHLGMFTSEIAAAIAYDRAAKKYFGEFAHLNFPNGEPDMPEHQKLPSTYYKQSDYI